MTLEELKTKENVDFVDVNCGFCQRYYCLVHGKDTPVWKCKPEKSEFVFYAQSPINERTKRLVKNVFCEFILPTEEYNLEEIKNILVQRDIIEVQNDSK